MKSKDASLQSINTCSVVSNHLHIIYTLCGSAYKLELTWSVFTSCNKILEANINLLTIKSAYIVNFLIMEHFITGSYWISSVATIVTSCLILIKCNECNLDDVMDMGMFDKSLLIGSAAGVIVGSLLELGVSSYFYFTGKPRKPWIIVQVVMTLAYLILFLTTVITCAGEPMQKFSVLKAFVIALGVKLVYNTLFCIGLIVIYRRDMIFQEKLMSEPPSATSSNIQLDQIKDYPFVVVTKY